MPKTNRTRTSVPSDPLILVCMVAALLAWLTALLVDPALVLIISGASIIIFALFTEGADDVDDF